jgi:hypothetical protein
MTPTLRKLNLTAHIALSVAWIGAAAAFLVLPVAGLTTQDESIVRGAYLSMDLICLYSIVPLSFAALGTGLIQSLGTQWGLFRHYWVLAKFLLTTVAVAVLQMHQFAAIKAAKIVLEAPVGTLSQVELRKLGFDLLRASGLGIVALLVVMTLSVYKPWGLTNYGWRKQDQRRIDPLISPQAVEAMPMGGLGGNLAGNFNPWLVIGVGVFVLAIVISMHLSGHSFHQGH